MLLGYIKMTHIKKMKILLQLVVLFEQEQYRAYARLIMAAILGFQNNGMEAMLAMLVLQTNPVRVQLLV